MTNKEETDVTESQIVRASVLESHGWSSEKNRSQCKFRNKFSCFFVILIFSFRSSLLLFILRDTPLARKNLVLPHNSSGTFANLKTHASFPKNERRRNWF